MSRGDRVAVNGNLSMSMRDNYGEHGVEEYYKKVGSTYRNPHYPGIRLCLFSWLNSMQYILLTKYFPLGSGEATLAFVEWCNTGKTLYLEQHSSKTTTRPDSDPTPVPNRPPVIPRRKGQITPCLLGPDFPRPRITAADPFTAAAFKERTTYPCAELSFEAIAEGELPQVSVNIVDGSLLPISSSPHAEGDSTDEGTKTGQPLLQIILSTKARWLVILAPHKKPEVFVIVIKNGWGWVKWDVDAWKEVDISDSKGELLHERVHCRVYRSANF
ncbi:hypothetical protein CPB84DRAFT_1744093 [Gymnopilus junonius]|uniref:Uncharacterized protein n=1 Tax=Gymnopilus junonius TaxID=109634 RepID=A0A9P5NZD1_GYMJU|nr:hypothetical protein CPB84DRAFT_1744093 [Gymnopilus junonius]